MTVGDWTILWSREPALEPTRCIAHGTVIRVLTPWGHWDPLDDTADALCERAALEWLRRNVGASVRLHSTNPRGDEDRECVVVCDEWTGWKDRSFYGIHLGHALWFACKARLDHQDEEARAASAAQPQGSAP